MTPPAKKTDETALLWWVRVMVNVAVKLYGPTLETEFARDLQTTVRNIRRFRETLRSFGWTVPNAEQERLIGCLVVRCRKYLLASKDPRFIAGYFGKALRQYVDELADDLNTRYKGFPTRKDMSPEARVKLDAVLLLAEIESLKLRYVGEGFIPSRSQAQEIPS